MIFGGIRLGGGMGMIIFGMGISIYFVFFIRFFGLCLILIYFDLYLYGVMGWMWIRNIMVVYFVLFFILWYRFFVFF